MESKTTNQTTVIYEYGARLDKACVADVNQQFYLAQRQYNDTIAVIREIRASAYEWLYSHGGAEIRAAKTRLDKAVQLKDLAIAAQHEDQISAAFKEVREAKYQLWSLSKPLRKEHAEEMKERFWSRIGMRKECDTYRIIAQYTAAGLGRETADMTHTTALRAWGKVATDGGDVSFRKASERASDHIDIRFSDSGGVSTTDLFGRHRSFSLTMDASKPIGRKHFGAFTFRIGSAKDGKYATGSFEFHRPFPEGSRVTTVRLVRKRFGTWYRWYLQFQLSSAMPTIAFGERKKLGALHLGWDRQEWLNEDDVLSEYRCIAGLADAADSGLARLIGLPMEIPEAMERAQDVASQRSVALNEFMPVFKAILPTQFPDGAIEEFHRLCALPATRVNPARLRSLNRALSIAGVDCPVLEAFVTEDKKQEMVQRFTESKARKRRRDYYRHLALDLVRQYESIVICKPDLRESAKKYKADGEFTELTKKARAARVKVCLSEFVGCLEWAAKRANTTLWGSDDFEHVFRCSHCGQQSVERIEGRFQFGRCSHCGHEDWSKANSAASLFQWWVALADHRRSVVLSQENKKTMDAAQKKSEKLQKMRDKRMQILNQSQQNNNQNQAVM